MPASERRQRLRGLLEGDLCVRPAPVFDPISARIAQGLGFQVGILAGSVASAIVLGAPDVLVLTLTELAQQARRITRASDLSLLVDADHGYGNALNVMRTVEELEAAGVAGLTLEDTVLPRPFRQQPGQEILPLEAMTGKLKAALAARRDLSLVIVGRTSVALAGSAEEAARRVQAYADVGVDAIFLAGMTTRDQLLTVRKATSLPLLLGSTPPALGDMEFLRKSGVRIALAGQLPFQMSVKATYDALKYLKEGGAPAAMRERAASDELMFLVTKQEDYARWQNEFLG